MRGRTGKGLLAASITACTLAAAAGAQENAAAEAGQAFDTAFGLATALNTSPHADACHAAARSFRSAELLAWSGSHQASRAFEVLGGELDPLCDRNRRAIEKAGLLRLIRLALMAPSAGGQNVAARLDESLGTQWTRRLARL